MMDASGVGARSGLPWTACATPEGSSRGGHHRRKPYRSLVDALLREGKYTAQEIAKIIGHGCDEKYVRSAAAIIRVYPLRNEALLPFKPRPVSEIRADLARQLETIERRYYQELTAARVADPI